MDKTTSGFYVIDVLTLKQPSNKPFHLDTRMKSKRQRPRNSQGNLISPTSAAGRKLAAASARRSAILEARKTRATNRLSHVRQVLARQKELETQEQIKKRYDLLQRMATSEQRRTLLRGLSKSKLDHVVQGGSESDSIMKDIASMMDSAAVTIQHSWRSMKWAPVINAWKKNGLSLRKVSKTTFEQMIQVVQSEALIKVTTALVSRVKKMSGSDMLFKNPARIFLSAYMITAHPQEILASASDEDAKIIKEDAENMVAAFEAFLSVFDNHGDYFAQFQVFNAAWGKFYTAFEDWKRKDSEKLIDGMVAHFIELERLWITVKEQPGAEMEFKPKITTQQKHIQVRLKRFGNQGLDKLRMELSKLRAELKEQEEHVDTALPANGPFKTSPEAIPSSRHRRGDSVTESPRFVDNESSSSSSGTEMPKHAAATPMAPAPVQAMGFDMSNQALAHELVMNPDFELTPNKRSPLEEQIRAVARKAFFDACREEIEKGEYANYVPGLITDIRESFLSMVAENGRISKEIKEVLDLEFIQQQITNKALDMPKLVGYVIDKMLSLCAPIRDADIRAIREKTDLTDALQSILDILDLMKLDLANFRLQQLKPVLKQQAVEYEQAKFAEDLAAGKITLDNTKAWLETSANALKEVAAARNPEGVEIPENRVRYEEIYNDALLDIVFSSNIIDTATIAETLSLDAERLFGFQNEAQAITIVAALMMLSKNLSDGFRRDEASHKQVKDTLFVLLKDSDTTIHNLSIQIVSSINASLAKLNRKPLTEEQEKIIEKMVDKTLSFKDTIYLMLNRRIMSHVKNQLTTGIFKKEALTSHGLDIVQVELEDLSKRMLLLAKHNKEVYAKYYDEIIKAALA